MVVTSVINMQIHVQYAWTTPLDMEMERPRESRAISKLQVRHYLIIVIELRGALTLEVWYRCPATCCVNLLSISSQTRHPSSPSHCRTVRTATGSATTQFADEKIVAEFKAAELRVTAAKGTTRRCSRGISLRQAIATWTLGLLGQRLRIASVA